jgi:hypothetical protein
MSVAQATEDRILLTKSRVFLSLLSPAEISISRFLKSKIQCIRALDFYNAKASYFYFFKMAKV